MHFGLKILFISWFWRYWWCIFSGRFHTSVVASAAGSASSVVASNWMGDRKLKQWWHNDEIVYFKKFLTLNAKKFLNQQVYMNNMEVYMNNMEIILSTIRNIKVLYFEHLPSRSIPARHSSPSMSENQSCIFQLQCKQKMYKINIIFPII
jgi:hypothetical protein